MKAIDLIRGALQMSAQGTDRIVDGMRDAAMTQPAPAGGNHTLWLLGHLAFIEGVMRPILLGEPNPVAHWAPLFATGTTPGDDASKYPPFDEVLAKYRELRAGTLKLLDAFGESGLDRKPANVPPGFEEAMATVGQALVTLALHNMVHYGQVADARRAAGRPPLM